MGRSRRGEAVGRGPEPLPVGRAPGCTWLSKGPTLTPHPAPHRREKSVLLVLREQLVLGVPR